MTRSIEVVLPGGSGDDAEPTTVARTRQRFGRYRLVLELASGGMATVFLARVRDEASGEDRAVAVKRIHPHLARQSAFVEMFLDEARIASRIRHPNVCRVHDFGAEDGSYFIAMEYLVGETVAKLAGAVARWRDVPADWPAVAAHIVVDACAGLHAAHELRDASGAPLEIVHRDVSPQNLFVGYDGAVRVVDFGIASAQNKLHQTTTGEVKGKHAYMAPEQLRGERVDRRADVWSLGVVLWELLALERLFRRPTESETILAVTTEPVPPPSLVRPGVPETLDAIVLRALARDREDRWASAEEMAAALREAVPARPAIDAVIAAAFPEGAARRTELITTVMTDTDAPEPPARPGFRRAIAAGIALGVAAIGGGGIVYLAQTSGEPEGVTPVVVVGYEAPSATPDAGREIEAEPVPEASVAEEPFAEIEPEEPRPRVRKAPRRRARAATERATTGEGTVNIVTPGGWAEVRVGGRVVGESPARVRLPAGRQRIELWPSGSGPARTVTVTVREGETQRVVVTL